ncbi:hypothetical protein CEXT_388531 [Caerostris extrusa]|uniref:Uncharacterized protein n=1 Tax=Caerostris extrusa TaxID=172846 RepID=A0AAV4W8F5_CAEEX|nr:hypothetical protein CEXT_388531 [Caerostris extrusa]
MVPVEECLLQDENRFPLDLPRRIGLVCFRMWMGDDYLKQYLNKIGVTTAKWTSDSMNGRHLLICSKLKDVYSGDASHFSLLCLYWTARQRMAD